MRNKSDAGAAIEHYVRNGRLVKVDNRDDFKKELCLTSQTNDPDELARRIDKAVARRDIVYVKQYGELGFCSAGYAKSYGLDVLKEPGLPVTQPIRQSVNA